MYIKLNRTTCDIQLAVCERCLGQVLKFPMGYERQCFEEVIDDGSDLLTLEITSGENKRILVLNEEERLMMAGEGWAKLVDFDVPFYREKR